MRKKLINLLWNSNWNTNDEIKFLDNLGYWSLEYRGIRIDYDDMNKRRLDLLKQYEKSIKSREDWGDIDVGLIKEYFRRYYENL